MRVLLPLRDTVLEFLKLVDLVDFNGKPIFPDTTDLVSFKTTIYEDNNADLSLAVNQRITSRTKHWNVKFHFFWSHLHDTSKNIHCVKVSSDLQRADYLTKGLVFELFKNCQKLNQGW